MTLAEVRSLTADNASQQNRLDKLDLLIAERLRLVDQGITLRRNDGFDSASRLILSDRGKLVMDQIRVVVSDMESQERSLLVKRQGQRQVNASMTLKTVGLGAVFSILIAVLAAVMLRRDNARRFEVETQLERSNLELSLANDQVEALAALGDALQSASTVPEVTRVTADRIAPLLRVDYLALSRREDDVMRVQNVWGTIPDAAKARVEAGIHRSEGGQVWKVVETDTGVYNEAYNDQPGHLELNLPGHAIAMEPVRGSDGQIQGVLSAGRASSLGSWRPNERTMLERAAKTLGLAFERAEAIKALNEVRFRRVLETSLLGVNFWDANRKIVEANDAFLNMVGFTRSEFEAGMLDLRAITAPEHVALDDHSWEDLRTNGVTGVFEKDYILRDGRRINVMLGNALLGEEKIVGVSFVIDMTQQRRIQRQTLETEERFRTLIEATTQIVWTTPDSGEFESVQPSWAAFTGQSYKEYVGTGWKDAIHPDDLAKTVEAWTHSLKTGTIYKLEHRLRRFDNQYRDMEARGVPILEPDGTVREWIGIHSDVTERIRTENALRESELHARELVEMQKRFVSDASHELRAPLTAIQGNLELLRLYPNMVGDEREEALTEAEREASRLGRLVADLLALARGDNGATVATDELELQPVALEAWAQAQRMSQRHAFELRELESLSIVGNRDRIKQLILILLENAIKYTPSNGTIRLSLKRLDGFAQLEVSDTGAGIAPEDLSHVFERFYRADQSRTRGFDPGGTGLGLPIADWITKLHGGEIWLESQFGRGTSAFVKLPLLESKPIESKPGLVGSPSNSAPQKNL
jgi:PAS domain S-box-containing protein